MDYLLKPFDADRFATALARVKGVVGRGQKALKAHVEEMLRALSRDGPGYLERLLADRGGRPSLIDVRDVVRFQSARNYVRLHLSSGFGLLRSTLTNLERRLDPVRFLRVNRSEIVNAAAVRTLEPVGHGDWEAGLADGTRVRISRRYRDRLRQFEVEDRLSGLDQS